MNARLVGFIFPLEVIGESGMKFVLCEIVMCQSDDRNLHASDFTFTALLQSVKLDLGE